MFSKILGQLRPTEYNQELFESSPTAIPFFDNLPLIVLFVDVENRLYLDGADRVLQNFFSLNSIDRNKNSEIVYQYYTDTLKHGYSQPLNISHNQDVWKFITPNEIIIDWNENCDFFLCVSCECEWEKEHGLQLVFKNGQILTRAGGHDGHFTD